MLTKKKNCNIFLLVDCTLNNGKYILYNLLPSNYASETL